MRAGEGTSPPHVLAAGHKERFAVFEERNHLFTKAFHLFQHRMELEEKGPHPNITEFVKPISNGLRGADQASGCSPVRSNMTSRVSIRQRHHRFFQILF